MPWGQTANIKGPQGIQGTPGVKGDTGTKGDQGAKGDQGIQGIQGVQGERGFTGEDGKGIAIKGSVATYAALPTQANTPALVVGDGYLVQSDGKLYIWTGSAFPASGAGTAFQGPKGDQGIQGVQGEQGVQGIQGNAGTTGLKGDKGDKGDTGNTGLTGNTGTAGARGSKWFVGAGVPGTVAGSAVGDQYLDSNTGIVYSLT